MRGIRGESRSECVGHRLRDDHVDHLANQVHRPFEVDDAIVLRPTAELERVATRHPLHEDALHRADHTVRDLVGLLIDARLQSLQPLELDLLGRIVGEIRRRRAGTPRIDERKRGVETDVVDELHRLVEIL